MHFRPSEDHQMLSDTLRRYLQDAYSPELRSTAAYTAPYHAPKVWAGLCDLGILDALLTPEQGGLAGGAEDVAVVFEELGRGLCAEPVLAALMGLRLLALTGRDELVAQLMAGEGRCAFAVFEPEAAHDLAHLHCTARRQGAENGGWRLEGRKSAVYGAPGATHLLVAARTPAGLGLFLVEEPELWPAGQIDGGGTAEIRLQDQPAECLQEDAQAAIEEVLDLARIALCAEAVGAMDRLVALTVDYLKQRRQFGRALASFQALQHRTVDMVVELEQSRSITLAAIAAFPGPERARKTAMAKNLIGRAGRMIAEAAIQLHGGIGMTWEYAGAHYAKRLVMIDHQLGDHRDQLHRLQTLSRGIG